MERGSVLFFVLFLDPPSPFPIRWGYYATIGLVEWGCTMAFEDNGFEDNGFVDHGFLLGDNGFEEKAFEDNVFENNAFVRDI